MSLVQETPQAQSTSLSTTGSGGTTAPSLATPSVRDTQRRLKLEPPGCTSWAEAMRRFYDETVPAPKLQHQRRPVDITTTCSGTGAPTIGLEERMRVLKCASTCVQHVEQQDLRECSSHVVDLSALEMHQEPGMLSLHGHGSCFSLLIPSSIACA